MVLFLLCVGVQLLQALLSISGFYQPYPNLMHVGTWLLFANGPATWLMLKPHSYVKWSRIVMHFLPCLLAFVWLLGFYQLDESVKSQVYFSVELNKMLFWVAFLVHWAAYLLVTWLRQLKSGHQIFPLMWLVLLLCGAIYCAH